MRLTDLVGNICTSAEITLILKFLKRFLNSKIEHIIYFEVGRRDELFDSDWLESRHQSFRAMHALNHKQPTTPKIRWQPSKASAMHISSIPIPQTQVINTSNCNASNALSRNVQPENQKPTLILCCGFKPKILRSGGGCEDYCALPPRPNGLTFATMRAVRFLAPPKYFHNIDPNSFFRFCWPSFSTTWRRQRGPIFSQSWMMPSRWLSCWRWTCYWITFFQTGSQSCDFWIYSYNAGVVVG
jgi:hypothetical protein